jgi:arylsulfatase A-like enzyme
MHALRTGTIAVLLLGVWLAASLGLAGAWQAVVANDYVNLGMWVNVRSVLRASLAHGLMRGLGFTVGGVLIAAAALSIARLRARWRIAIDRAGSRLAAALNPLARPVCLLPVLLLPLAAVATAWLLVDRRAEAALAAHAGAARPNVILLVVDTLRADHLGVYGSDAGISTNIDAFASSAIVYRNTTAQSPCTINSSPSMLASLYPSEHRYVDYKTRISDGLVTVAEAFREAGYDTFAVSSNPHVSRRNGLAQGFDTFLDLRKWADTDAEPINRDFLAWLPDPVERPFFAMLWYIDPHEPYEPPPDFMARHLDETQRAEVERVLELRKQRVSLNPADQRVLEALYRAEIDYFDSQFATLTAELRERGLLDDAVVTLTSDHGESFGEHIAPDGARLYGHGLSLYETELAVPWILKLPGSQRSGEVRVAASSIDLAPTLLDAAGVAPPAGMPSPYRGRSLLREVAPHGSGDRPVFSELITDQYGPFFMQSVQSGTLKRVDTFQYRDQAYPEPLTQWLDRTRGEVDVSGAPSGEHGDRNRLETAMAGWRDQLALEVPSAASLGAEEEEALRDQLRVLGYIE